MTMSKNDDRSLISAVLDSLPSSLRHGRRLFIEGQVHRWVDMASGLPAGYPARDPDSRHQPDPEQNPELFVVGDYLFDSTINGVLDSADTVAEWIAEDIQEEESAIEIGNGAAHAPASDAPPSLSSSATPASAPPAAPDASPNIAGTRAS